MNEALVQLDNQELDFSNPGVRKAVRQMVESKALAEFPKAFNRLLDIADSEDERNALSAIRILGEMAGCIKNKSQVDVRISFDDLRRQPSNDPLASLFDIKTADVIEAEVDDEE